MQHRFHNNMYLCGDTCLRKFEHSVRIYGLLCIARDCSKDAKRACEQSASRQLQFKLALGIFRPGAQLVELKGDSLHVRLGVM